MIRVVIIEDEPLAANRLKKMVLQLDKEISVIAILDSISASIKWLSRNSHPELIFLDIQLADGLSFEIFDKISVNSPVILTTAFDEFALKAFDLNSIAYLLKPIKQPELEEAFAKFKEWTISSPAMDPFGRTTRFLVRLGHSLVLVKEKDFAYFFAEHGGTYLRVQSGKKYLIDEKLDDLEKKLDSKLFFRINRGFIIGLSAIDKMEMASKSRILIKVDPAHHEAVISSTDKSPVFKKWLKGQV